MLCASGLCPLQTTADDPIRTRRTISVVNSFAWVGMLCDKTAVCACAIALLLLAAVTLEPWFFLYISCVFMDGAPAATCITTHVHVYARVYYIVHPTTRYHHC